MMDGRRFDAITRLFVAKSSRRTALKGLAAAVLGAAPLARLATAEAGGCKMRGQPCKVDRDCCSGRCLRGQCRRRLR